MKSALLLSCFLMSFITVFGCATGPTDSLIEASNEKTFSKDINRVFCVIEFKSLRHSKARPAEYKPMHLGYVRRIAEHVLEKASGLEVEYIDNKKTDGSFVLIKLKSRPSCEYYMLGGYKCPGGSVFGSVSLYLRGEKIYFETFKHHEPAKYYYKDLAPNNGERYALRKSEFAHNLWKIGLEIKKYSSK